MSDKYEISVYITNYDTHIYPVVCWLCTSRV